MRPVVGRSEKETRRQRPTAKAGGLGVAMAVARGTTPFEANGGSTSGWLTAARAAILSAAFQSAGKVNPHWRQRKWARSGRLRSWQKPHAGRLHVREVSRGFTRTT